MLKRQQPAWKPPASSDGPVLRLYNSLTRRKEEFVPMNGRRIRWYSCGPTVYDAAHMGHARSYISFDILRRVLADYFGYDILYVMNITDVDDKIIKRARQMHLYDAYVLQPKGLDELLRDAGQALDGYATMAAAADDPDKKRMMLGQITRMDEAVTTLKQAVQSNDEQRIDKAQGGVLFEAKDPLCEWLDKRLGHTVTNNAVFCELPRRWEESFHRDMDALNVLRPNVLTRVSEYIPEIVEYIQHIMNNKLAYESNGSVYFDVGAFDAREVHHYAKLVPEAYGDARSLREGEGELSVAAGERDKRSATDFALWKKGRSGEPSWESPWGSGRPGWHIECSAMACEICGPSLDVHAGGVDLRFPHHDNELAQTEGRYGAADWVKYFLHSGHLTIAGCKMSKSLKNFVTIEQALENHSARQLRFAFLLHPWRDPLDYSDSTMEEAVSCERVFNEFFLTVKDVARNTEGATTLQTFDKWSAAELALSEKLALAKEKVHTALCDNVDTRTCVEALRELVGVSNVYMRERKPPNALLLHDIARYITWILQVFGAIDTPRPIGFPTSTAAIGNTEQIVMPYLRVMAEFRDSVRAIARRLGATDILAECDRLRDEVLPEAGVRLEDREIGPAAVKLTDPITLAKERETKRAAELQRAVEKAKRKAEEAAKEAVKQEQRKIRPEDMFLAETDKYSKFDEKGLPTHDTEGKELSKGMIKKLLKLQQAQEKRHKEYSETL